MTYNPTRLAPVAAVVALLLAGCGGGGDSSQPDTTPSTTPSRAKLMQARLAQPAGCFVTVYLSESVTEQQRRHVELLLLSSPRIRTVSFVSKALALKRLAERQPEIARGMHVNPFPDQYEVVVGTRADVFGLIADFAAGVDGVTNVRASRACGAQG